MSQQPFNYTTRHRAWLCAFFREVLKASDGNMSRAAKLAGINRTHFYRRCRQLGVQEGIRRVKSEGNSEWKRLGQMGAQ